jgi:hypothetical protein
LQIALKDVQCTNLKRFCTNQEETAGASMLIWTWRSVLALKHNKAKYGEMV